MNVTSRRNMKYTNRDNVSRYEKHPLVKAKTCQSLGCSKEPIIRLRVDKPADWDWELTTTAENLPVIQLLDRDGRLLVETSGKTAQRARGSFRDGLKSHEEFPRQTYNKVKDVVQVDRLPTGNRNLDGFSTKFGYQDIGSKGPKKSQSDVAVDRQKRNRAVTVDQREDKNSQNKEVKNKSRADSLNRRKVGYDADDEKVTKSGKRSHKHFNSIGGLEDGTTGMIKSNSDSMADKIFMRRVASQRTLPEVDNHYRARKTRSDVNLGMSIREEQTRNNKKRCGRENSNGKRKVYRKTKSDMFLEGDCDPNVTSPPRRIRSQDNVERSWREYRERKREERLQKNAENNELYPEEDFMKKPRWKDLMQHGSCSKTNCKICANMQNCFDPFKVDRPDTALQENYLVVQPVKTKWDVDDENFDKTSNRCDQNGHLLMPSFDQVDNGRVFLQKLRGDNENGLVQNDTENNVKDYFKRVYDLLKTRRKLNPGQSTQAISSHPTIAKGENVVAVTGPTKSRNWDAVERVLVSSDTGKVACCAKRPRHYYSAPVLPKAGSYCKHSDNAKDIGKYFSCSNKENKPDGVKLKEERTDQTMGSNLSRHNDKGLNGRRTQSSGNLCDPKKRLNSVSRILMPCSDSSKESRYKFCGSLPNHLDGKESIDDSDLSDNNNVISDIIGGNLGGTLPYKKKSSVHFCDTSPSLDLVKHHSQDSLGGDPWLYRQDLDLVKCKHQQDTSGLNGNGAKTCKLCLRGKSLNEKLQRRSDLDLVGSYSKRPPHESARRNASCPEDDFRRKCSVNGTESANDDLLIKARHNHDSLPFKYPRLSTERKIDRTAAEQKVKKLFGNEPQDQGYASERSPEEEHPPKLPEQALSNGSESTFTVTLQKSSRGLGLSVSGGGSSGPVRVKRLFPQQPAALSNKLKPGDILLAANGVSLTSLTNYEALEVLRTTSSTVELLVQRVAGEGNVTTPPQELPPPLPVRREAAVTRVLDPLAPLDVEPCGEFDIEMTKVAGSLGFTLRKADSSALGHYVRALVREPALSDGRIQPGDKIVAVDGALLSPMSHEEAVTLLRQCGPRVKLRLYRDMTQTPVSALSPTEPNDHPLRPPHTSLRQEAVDMLCDLAVRKLSPATSSGSSTRKSANASCSSPRKLKRPGARTPTAESVLIKSDSGQTSSNDVEPGSYDVCDSSDSNKVHRPSFLDLSAPPGKPHFQFSVDSDEYSGPMIVTDSDSNLDEVTSVVAAPTAHQQQNHLLACEPASMPPLLSNTDTAAFSHKNPVYQSANPATGANIDTIKNKVIHSSDQDIPGTLDVEDPGGSQGLLKWKGVMFAPQTYRSIDENEIYKNEDDESAVTSSTINDAREQGHEVFMVELTRGWNSRLGFSLQPEGDTTVISVVHPDSVAAKDGRLKQGDVLIMVNDESVEKMSTADIIDLLRKIRGSIGITVLRRKKDDHV